VVVPPCVFRVGGRVPPATKQQEGRGYPPLMLKEGGPPPGLISYLTLFIVGNPQEMAPECGEVRGGWVPLSGPEGWGYLILKEGWGTPHSHYFINQSTIEPD